MTVLLSLGLTRALSFRESAVVPGDEEPAVVRLASVCPTRSRTNASIRCMNSGSRTSVRRMRASWASHSPVSAALFTGEGTRSTSRMPVSVAARALPCRSA